MSDMKGLKKDMGEHSTRASLYGCYPQDCEENSFSTSCPPEGNSGTHQCEKLTHRAQDFQLLASAGFLCLPCQFLKILIMKN